MSSLYRSAEVYIRGEYAGILRETDAGYSFVYDVAYLQSDDAVAASLTLPLAEEEYSSPTLFPFFDGLIPEGWLLDVAIRNWKLSRSDRFGLLLKCCQDCIGDVSIKEVADEV